MRIASAAMSGVCSAGFASTGFPAASAALCVPTEPALAWAAALLVAIRADEYAPSLEDVGWENPLSLRRQSHKSIDEAMYTRIARAIVDAAGEAVAV